MTHLVADLVTPGEACRIDPRPMFLRSPPHPVETTLDRPRRARGNGKIGWTGTSATKLFVSAVHWKEALTRRRPGSDRSGAVSDEGAVVFFGGPGGMRRFMWQLPTGVLFGRLSISNDVQFLFQRPSVR